MEHARLIKKGQRRRGRRLNIKELLLAEEPRFENIVPERGRWKLRATVDFDTESQSPHRSRKKRG